jgi:hypothetical protein
MRGNITFVLFTQVVWEDTNHGFDFVEAKTHNRTTG